MKLITQRIKRETTKKNQMKWFAVKSCEKSLFTFILFIEIPLSNLQYITKLLDHEFLIINYLHLQKNKNK